MRIDGYQPTERGSVPDCVPAGPRKLRKIKTIKKRLDYHDSFDAEVNEALADGWYLVRRYTLPSYNVNTAVMLIAELQRYDYE